MITTSTLWLDVSLGLLAAGLVFGALLLLTWWDRRRQERAAAQLHVPQHRALDASPVEVIRRGEPDVNMVLHRAFEAAGGRMLDGPTEERTEEMPALVEETPVEHHGADADWSPTAELRQVPVRPLDPERIDVRRHAARGRRLARTVDEDKRWHRNFDRAFDPILAEIARVGQADTHTCEWTAEEFAALLATAGAR